MNSPTNPYNTAWFRHTALSVYNLYLHAKLITITYFYNYVFIL